MGIVRGVCLRAHTVAPLRRWGTTIRNVYRINEGLHPPMSDRVGWEKNNRQPRNRISSHRRSGKKSQTAARMDGHRKPGKFLGRRLSPWKLFGSVFFAKKRNSRRRVERCVCRNVVAAGIVQDVVYALSLTRYAGAPSRKEPMGRRHTFRT